MMEEIVNILSAISVGMLGMMLCHESQSLVGAVSCMIVDSVVEIGVSGVSCYMVVSNPVPGFLPRSWGSPS